MKRTLFAFISVAALGLTAVGASVAQIRAPDPAPPEAVSRYMVGTRLGYITCSNKYRDFVAQWDKFSFKNEGKTTVAGSPPSEQDYQACVQETLVKGREMYPAAAKQETTAPAKAALKNYQTAWEASLTTLGRPGGEKPAEYKARQSKVQAQLDELQRKVEAQPK